MGFSIKDVDQRLVKGNRVLCPRCGKGDAEIHPVYGVLVCNSCKHKRQWSEKGISRKRPMTEWEKKKLK
jgi:uncharacterized protein (DUF983 family)